MTASKAIEDAIFALLSQREASATICPSEVARKLAPTQWKTLMPSVREVAAQLAIDGRLIATQKGKEVNALTAHGPIRLKSMDSHFGESTKLNDREQSTNTTRQFDQKNRSHKIAKAIKAGQESPRLPK